MFHYNDISMYVFFLMIRLPPRSTLFPYTTLFRSVNGCPNSCARFQVADIGLKGVLATDENGSQSEGFRSEEHTSELQSHHELVCRLLLEKKKKNSMIEFTKLKIVRQKA